MFIKLLLSNVLVAVLIFVMSLLLVNSTCFLSDSTTGSWFLNKLWPDLKNGSHFHRWTRTKFQVWRTLFLARNTYCSFCQPWIRETYQYWHSTEITTVTILIWSFNGVLFNHNKIIRESNESWFRTANFRVPRNLICSLTKRLCVLSSFLWPLSWS